MGGPNAGDRRLLLRKSSVVSRAAAGFSLIPRLRLATNGFNGNVAFNSNPRVETLSVLFFGAIGDTRTLEADG
jgi:hypothetical protein